MEKQKKLDKILDVYQSNFDIEREYEVGDRKFYAYGHFNVDNSKYVLVKRAKLWEANCQEHVFFDTTDNADIGYFDEIDKFIKEVAEPEFVRHNEKYPPKNHMYTYITIVVFTKEKLSEEIIRRIKKYHFLKNYLMTIRGYSETRLCFISDYDNKVVTNNAGREMLKPYSALIR